MLINANALHIPLKDKSVQCCVTSPPYWGLRDYGTAEWVGGDENCSHVERTNKHGGTSNRPGLEDQKIYYRESCAKCGAERIDKQLGLEQTPEEYVENMVAVFHEVWRVLRDDGTLWLNLGDSYNGKQLIGIPWRVAFALQADGWYLRNDIIWHKPNPMPESVTDRCTKSHEYIFLLTKNARYYYDNEAIKEDVTWIENRASGMERNAEAYRDKVKGKYNSKKKYGGGGSSFIGHSGGRKANGELINPSGKRNKRTVWTVTTKPYSGAHYATFPPDLIDDCVKAGTAAGDIVLDPFVGSGTTCLVARDLGRESVGLDLSFDYLVNNARVRLELDKLEYWYDRGPEVKGNFEGLPMFTD